MYVCTPDGMYVCAHGCLQVICVQYIYYRVNDDFGQSYLETFPLTEHGAVSRNSLYVYPLMWCWYLYSLNLFHSINYVNT